MAWTKTYSGSEPMRVNKWLATEGVCSRREADALIEKGLVKINGEVLTEAGYKIEDGQTLSLTEKAARRLDNQLSLMFHKPIGIVSGTPEPGEIPAVRLINEESLSGRAHAIPGRNNKLAPLGRLDKDSRGLLIMSEDGVLAKALIGPESKLEKEYHVKVRGDVTEEKLKLLRHGLELDGRQLRPAAVTVIKGNELKFLLREGRNRQIRRMCDLVDLRVLDLMRVRIGPLSLAGLPEGKWRPISARERDELLRWEAKGFSAEPTAPVIAEPVRRPAPAGKRPPAGGERPPAAGKKPLGKPRSDAPPSSKPKPNEPKFKRTKLTPRKRTPIK
ncbi:MAG: pseudouridine synthase [Hyphomonas oceanitis]|uniref:pseudouridine synthase n=1 Tax=Hyphomonas oceanitis TaxID=81033 RepID=UPI003002A229